MELRFRLIYVISILLVALIAGLFYAFSCAVNRGLGQLGNREYLTAMKSINQVILNPWFVISFMGAPVAGTLAVWAKFTQHGYSLSFWLLLTGLLIYLVGTFLVTVAGNVPLNNMLAAFDIQAATHDRVTAMREAFEKPWNRFHGIRTIANIVSLVIALIALIR